MPTPRPSKQGAGVSLDQQRRIDQACDRFESALIAGHQPVIEQFLAELEDIPRPPVLHHLLDGEIDYRLRQGIPVDGDGWVWQAAFIATKVKT